MKRTFLGHPRPLLTAMIQAETPEDVMAAVGKALAEGCDAFGLQLCKLKPHYRTKNTYQSLFELMEDRPIYITNYRHAYNAGLPEEELAEGLVAAAQAGATLCDVIGDLFDPSPFELTENPLAVARQRELIDRIHSLGAEVLISSHIDSFLPAEKVLQIAFAQQERGADIAKIVTRADSQEEEIENLRATSLMKEKLQIPFLFLSNGSHYKLHRMIGPLLGSVMYLCVGQHDALSTKTQPLLSSVRQVLDGFAHYDRKGE